MKKSGLIIVLVGLLITLFVGFNYVTKEKVVDIGPVEMSVDQKHSVNWSPYLGIGLIAIGVIVYVIGAKNKEL